MVKEERWMKSFEPSVVGVKKTSGRNDVFHPWYRVPDITDHWACVHFPYAENIELLQHHGNPSRTNLKISSDGMSRRSDAEVNGSTL